MVGIRFDERDGGGIRPTAAQGPNYLDFGAFALDLDARILIDPAGREIALRRREFDLLLTLAQSSGRVMSRAALLDAIVGREAEAFDRTIDVYVGRLRRKLEADPKQPRVIVTVPGVGYRLVTRPRLLPASAEPGAAPRLEAAAKRAGIGILSAINRAHSNSDAAALAALYADDAVIFTPDGPLSGRTAIEETYARHYRQQSLGPSTLETVILIGNDVMLRAGRWSRRYHDESGPRRVGGYWTTTDVRYGDTWKIRMETRSIVPPP